MSYVNSSDLPNLDLGPFPESFVKLILFIYHVAKPIHSNDIWKKLFHTIFRIAIGKSIKVEFIRIMEIGYENQISM